MRALATFPLLVAVTRTELCAGGRVGVTWKVPELCPAGILRVAGGTTKLALLARVTVKPPVGAIPLSVTVPVVVAPGATVVGLKDIPFGTRGTTVRFPVAEPLLKDAVIPATVLVVTCDVVIGKVALVAPARTWTVDFTVAQACEELRATFRADAGAGPLRVTVPVAPVAATTLEGETVTETGVGARI